MKLKVILFVLMAVILLYTLYLLWFRIFEIDIWIKIGFTLGAVLMCRNTYLKWCKSPTP